MHLQTVKHADMQNCKHLKHKIFGYSDVRIFEKKNVSLVGADVIDQAPPLPHRVCPTVRISLLLCVSLPYHVTQIQIRKYNKYKYGYKYKYKYHRSDNASNMK